MFSKKENFWNKRAQDMTILDVLKLTGITCLIGFIPLGVITIKEALDDRKAAKKRKAEEQRRLEAIVNGQEDSDTTW